MPPSFRYSRWDGTQNLDALDADEVMDALSDDLMSYGDLSAALQRLYRWGTGDMAGLEHLLRQLREQRERELSRYDLDSTVESIREQLQDVIDTERVGIDRKVDQARPEQRKLMDKLARQRRNQLDRMPDDLGGRMKALRQYEFMDEGAREKFERLLQQLQEQMLNQMFQGLKQSIQSMTREDLGLVREMVRDLNRMLEQRRQGRDTSAQFRQFMQKYGHLFPPGIETLDQLLEHLQRQMAQMNSLMQSLSPQARDELRRMMDELLQDDSLRLELARLAAMMQQLMPPSELTERYPFFGDEPLSMQAAMGLMEQLQQMDRLESQLERGSFRLDDVDRGLLEQRLGPEARQQLDRMRQMTQILEKAGYVERRDRRLELTPRGMRRIGQGALRDIFDQLKKSRLGQHQIRPTGQGIESGEEVKPYEYGDPFLLDLNETLFNALEREGAGVPVKIEPLDFAVHRTEHSTQASTVLMIDMSRSMFLRGCFLAAKKVAIALDSLIRSQFPRDSLYVVGFSNYAVELRPQSLPGITLNDYVYGTNMQHGFQVARSLLAKHRGNRQVIMVTDGEPTAHLDERGHPFFAYPPSFRTIQETLREVRRCTRDRIVINTFMLERGPYLTEFVNQMTRINKGRAFFVSPERLGEYLLVDYVSGKQRRQRSRQAS
ncbi:MAG TPA: VWA domain-containing protein [Candidatus Dormibacteraeota bacterium]|nr:VWA domain-containing protein [Candidatus Dormibacteraeota bacterium]